MESIQKDTETDPESSIRNQASSEPKGMRPIWYFVGYMLSAIGILVFIAGLFNIYNELPDTTVVSGYHPDLWWGGVITLVGLFYVWKNKNTFVK